MFILGESVRADERHPNGLQDRRTAGVLQGNERSSSLSNAIDRNLLVHIRILQVHAGHACRTGSQWRNNLTRAGRSESHEDEGSITGSGAVAERAASDLRSRDVRDAQLDHSAHSKRAKL